jgi:hypothetical protein
MVSTPDVTINIQAEGADEALEKLNEVAEKAATLGLDLETRKAIARIRPLLPVNPRQVHLFTRTLDAPGDFKAIRDRWLSDRYVMVMVTGEPFLQSHQDDGEWVELPDGAYKFQAGKGLIPLEGWTPPDTAGLVGMIEGSPKPWDQITRTQWAVSDSEAKLMLAYAELGYAEVDGEPVRVAVAINEGIWSAFETAFPNCTFWYREGDPYQVRDFAGTVVGYIARGKFIDPDVAAQAHVLASIVDAEQ